MHYWQKPTGFASSTANGLETVQLAATGILDAVQSSTLAADERETALSAQLALKSIGYRSVPLDGVAFDEGRGIIPNRYGLHIHVLRMHLVDRCWLVHFRHFNDIHTHIHDIYQKLTRPNIPNFEPGTLELGCRDGRVMTSQGTHDTQLYVCGWLRRGPNGIIGDPHLAKYYQKCLS